MLLAMPLKIESQPYSWELIWVLAIAIAKHTCFKGQTNLLR